MDTSCEWKLLVNIVSFTFFYGCPLYVFVGQTQLWWWSFQYCWCYSSQRWCNKESLSNVGQVSKGFFSSGARVSQSYFPSRIVELLKYLATITTPSSGCPVPCVLDHGRLCPFLHVLLAWTCSSLVLGVSYAGVQHLLSYLISDSSSFMIAVILAFVFSRRGQ